MTSQKGSLLLIKIGNAGSPETFATLGGLQLTRMELNQEPMESDNLESGMWRKLLSHSGRRSVSLSGEGVFTDDASEEILRAAAFSGAVRNYQLTFGNGDLLAGAFLITEYGRAGEIDGEERFALTLESAGVIAFTPA